MRILVTNDDGVDADGIAAIARGLAGAGHQVVVVAPERNMSGMSAALGPVEVGAGVEHIEVHPAALDGDGIEAWSIAAPPALGVFAACQGGFGAVPDLVVSGVNAGLNTGRSVLHSGTVGAALTATTFGVAAMAVSLQVAEPWQWDTGVAVGLHGLRWLQDRPMDGAALNLNVPARPLAGLRGLRWAPLDRYGAVQTVGRDPEQGLAFELRSADQPPVPGSDLALVEEGWATATLLQPATAVDPGATPRRPLEGPVTVEAAARPQA
jgi:5'-nucleotidase